MHTHTLSLPNRHNDKERADAAETAEGREIAVQMTLLAFLCCSLLFVRVHSRVHDAVCLYLPFHDAPCDTALFEISNLLNTGLDKQSLAVLVELVGKPAEVQAVLCDLSAIMCREPVLKSCVTCMRAEQRVG